HAEGIVGQVGFPELPTRGGIQRKGLRTRRYAVKYPLDNDRVALHLGTVAYGVGPARGVFPGYPQALHVGGINLRQRRKMVAVGPTVVLGPVGIRGRQRTNGYQPK